LIALASVIIIIVVVVVVVMMVMVIASTGRGIAHVHKRSLWNHSFVVFVVATALFHATACLGAAATLMQRSKTLRRHGRLSFGKTRLTGVAISRARHGYYTVCIGCCCCCVNSLV
jgi:hypothetical protein